jgi:8-oxo-dGTP diphosphatase
MKRPSPEQAHEHATRAERFPAAVPIRDVDRPFDTDLRAGRCVQRQRRPQAGARALFPEREAGQDERTGNGQQPEGEPQLDRERNGRHASILSTISSQTLEITRDRNPGHCEARSCRLVAGLRHASSAAPLVVAEGGKASHLRPSSVGQAWVETSADIRVRHSARCRARPLLSVCGPHRWCPRHVRADARIAAPVEMSGRTVRVGVGVIVRDGDRVLLVRRRNVHGDGTWSTPGGHLEFGESLADCAAREATEETGAVVSRARFRAITNDVFDDERHYVTIWMEADYPGGDVATVADYELSDVGWFHLDALPEPLFLPFAKLLAGQCMPSPKR